MGFWHGDQPPALVLVGSWYNSYQFAQYEP